MGTCSQLVSANAVEEQSALNAVNDETISEETDTLAIDELLDAAVKHEKRTKYESLLQGDYPTGTLAETFETLFGNGHTREEIRENYTEIFGVSEGEIDEGIIEMLMAQPYDIFLAPSFESSIDLELLLASESPLEELPVIPEPPIYEPIGTNPLLSQEKTKDTPSSGGVIKEPSAPNFSPPSTSPSVSLVSKTSTSVTLELYYENSWDSDNSLQMYDPTISAWVPLLGIYGKPQASSQIIKINDLRPNTTYQFHSREFDWSTMLWENASISVQTDCPVSLISKTPTSITIQVSYPSDYTWGNRLQYYDLGYGEWTDVPGIFDYYAASGIYTVSGLSPETQCQFFYALEDQGSGVWGTCDFMFYITTDALPIVLYSAETSNLVFRFEGAEIGRFAGNNYYHWRQKMNTFYDDMYELVGSKPYNGEKIQIESTRDGAPHYMWVSGQPCQINQSAMAEIASRINMSFENSFGTMNMLSRCFDSYRWNFDDEFWVSFKTYYAVQKNNLKVCIDGDYYTGGAALKTFYKCGRYATGYDYVMANGSYNAEALTYTFICISEQIGWEPFTQAFEYFTDMDYTEVPATRLGKLNLFLTLLSDFSNQDVFAMLTWQERQVYQAEFDGVLDFSYPVSFTVPGVSKIEIDLNATANTTYLLALSGINLMDSFDKIFTFTYDPAVYTLVDFAAHRNANKTTVGVIPGTQIEILSSKAGEIVFRFNRVLYNSGWSGIMTVVKLCANQTGASTITLE